MAAPFRGFCELCGKQRKINVSVIKRWASAKPKVKPEIRQWQPVIGLEIHAQIQAEGKLFSRASSKFGAPVNSQVAFLDSALPGTLPALNRSCVEAGVKTAIALGCTVNKVSRFDRKHYFYADLPAGYQITQQNHAIANNGTFHYVLLGKHEKDCTEKAVHILQLQLEQDSGKSLHDEEDRRSLIDLNRAGCALMEIVTAPDFSSGEEAKCFVRDLRRLLITLGVCDGKMAEGSLRVDANISVHRPGEPLGVRSEVKNLNSMNSVKKAIEYEIDRQIGVLNGGGEVINETRSFDVDSGETVPMRDKEVQLDYRFMPEPNLPPLRLYHSCDLEKGGQGSRSSRVVIDDLEAGMPPLPQQQRAELMEKYGINMGAAAFIVNEGFQDFYEEAVVGRGVETFTQFFIRYFVAAMIEKEVSVEQCGVTPACFGDVYDWFIKEDISGNIAQEVIRAMLDTGVQPKDYLDDRDLWQINDVGYLTEICQKLIQENPAAVKHHKKGKERGLNKLIGLAKKASNGKGNPHLFHKIFCELMEDM